MKTRNEKILLAIFFAILFLGGNYYAYLWLFKQQAALDATCQQLQTDQLEAKVDLRDLASCQAQKAWIEAHQPTMGEEGDTKAQIQKVVSDGAHQNKLDILEQGLGSEVEQGPAGSKVTYSLKVKGSMEGICHWLAELQKPANFYAVSIDALQADQDLKSFVCRLQVARYYKPAGGS